MPGQTGLNRRRRNGLGPVPKRTIGNDHLAALRGSRALTMDVAQASTARTEALRITEEAAGTQMSLQ